MGNESCVLVLEKLKNAGIKKEKNENSLLLIDY
jgi:hypothetical protein